MLTFRQVLQRLHAIAYQVVKPHPVITDVYEQDRALLFSTASLALLLAICISIIVTQWFLVGPIVQWPHDLIAEWIGLLGLVLMLGCYSLSRTRYYHYGIVIFTIGANLMTIAWTLYSVQIYEAVFMIFPVFVTALFWSGRYTLAALVLQGAVIVLRYQSSLLISYELSFVLVFYFVFTVFIMTSLRLTQRARQRVTQQREQFTQSEQRNRAILNAFPDVLFRIDRFGTLLDYYVNDPDQLLMPPDQFLGKKIAQVGTTAIAAQLEPILQEAIEKHHATTTEISFVLNDKTAIYEVRFVPYQQDEALAILRNITQEKQAQQTAWDLQLEQERMALLSSFIRDASHEFRTPLTIINSSAHLIARHEVPEERKRRALVIEEQVKYLVHLIESIVKITRLDSQIEKLKMVPFNLHDVIEATIATRRASAERAKITLTLHPIPYKLPVLGDPVELQNALTHLINHTIQHTPPNGQITLSSECDHRQLTINLHHTGDPIPAAMIPHLFERSFATSNPSLSHRIGLGLPIAYRIIELHHGSIHVQSEPEQGTTFRIELPLDITGKAIG
ncbi:MAG: PAS domain-containing sensor histidine kinase [Anaerolineae bacterium]|jgi:signal transduction histidine kinase|nr:PAS domain-containing sensor histidine kinase [Anaerolineae bacterium]